jgi:FkbM family methyltransferase
MNIRSNFFHELQFRRQVLWRVDKKTREALSHIRPGVICVDVGANVGFVSRAFRSRGAIVHAIEPNPWAFESLNSYAKDDYELNAHAAAASVNTHPVSLFLHESHGSNPKLFSSGSSLISTKPNVNQESVEVAALDLAAFLVELGEVAFLKIDVEGFEVELIPNLIKREALERVNFIAVETHDKEKWTDLELQTQEMKSLVQNSGLETKFSWNWP